MKSDDKPTVFWLDGEHRILDVNAFWDDFALANDGQACTSARVRGRLLRGFVEGDVTWMWVDAVLRLARIRREPVVRPYRCDSPDERRYMRMSASMEEGSVMRLEHHFVKSEVRSCKLNMQAGGNGRVVEWPRCSICGRLWYGGDWVEAEAVLSEECGREPTTLGVLWVSYDVCPDCRLMSVVE